MGGRNENACRKKQSAVDEENHPGHSDDDEASTGHMDIDTTTEGDGGRAGGCVQWDPERDLMTADGRDPRMMLRSRAIQIGVSGSLSEFYAASALSIQEVTSLAHAVFDAHRSKKVAVTKAMM